MSNKSYPRLLTDQQQAKDSRNEERAESTDTYSQTKSGMLTHSNSRFNKTKQPLTGQATPSINSTRLGRANVLSETDEASTESTTDSKALGLCSDETGNEEKTLPPSPRAKRLSVVVCRPSYSNE